MTNTQYDIWNDETKVSEYEIEVPGFIEQDITAQDIAAIVQGGCASGAYMPAVFYHVAVGLMTDYGDGIFEIIEDAMGCPPADCLSRTEDNSWGQMATRFVSLAVEIWASGVRHQIEKRGAA
jgi:hypothetical protein